MVDRKYASDSESEVYTRPSDIRLQSHPFQPLSMNNYLPNTAVDPSSTGEPSQARHSQHPR